MKIVAQYDFNGGKNAVAQKYQNELNEIISVINSIDSSLYKNKQSKEKTMMEKMLFSPPEINDAFSREFINRGWIEKHQIICSYDNRYYYGESFSDYRPSAKAGGPPSSREMDFLKSKLGVEVQFGKYAFMAYDVLAKMPIFKNTGIIDTGIEIVPVKNFADEMSTGVSYFEQFAWDLTHRGTSNIDIPVLILGIDA